MACPDANVIAELVAGVLPREDRQTVETHLAGCQDCRTLVDGLGDAHGTTVPAAPPAPELLPGATVGRFVVVERLGAGGMGAVYAAHDPELDRKVALKLLHARFAQERLQAEARAMARLQHPNVVPVLDLGTHEGRLFLSMELVDGVTLRRWLGERPRTRGEILAALIEAGRGLQAAHAVGMTHRDFKPENILVGRDGRVRVADFGLARGGAPTQAVATHGQVERTTETAGTPLYMAPEQFRGGRVGPEADQFAFCVVAWEALHGELPFDPGDPPSLERLAEAVLSGRPRPPSKVKLPARLRRLLDRGLSPRPEDRFPLMAELLAALGDDPERTRRRRLAAAGALLVMALSAAGLYRLIERRQLCKGSELQLAGVWDAPRKRAVHAGFAATGLGYSEYAWAGVEKALDAYSRAWVAMRTDACEATRLRGDQSEEVLDLRMVCLSARRAELTASAELLAAADAKVVEKAVQVATGLTPLDGCADVKALKMPVRPPTDPAALARVEAARAQIARAKILEDSGKLEGGLRVAGGALDGARASSYPPVEAEALAALGSLQMALRQDAAAEKTLEQAFYAAESTGHDAVALRSATLLVRDVGVYQARHSDGERWSKMARAVLARTGGVPAEGEAALETALGLLRDHQGRYEEALAHDRRALQLRESALGPQHPLTGTAHNAIGTVLVAQGKFEEALAAYRRALAIREGALGPEHPATASTHNNVAIALQRSGRFDEAEGEYRRALAIRQTALPPDHPDIASAHNNLGGLYSEQGKLDQSLAEYQLALALREKKLGPRHPEVAQTRNNIADVLDQKGQHQAALEVYQQALAVLEATFGPAHPEVAGTHGKIGLALFNLGRREEALAELRRALALQEKALGPEHLEVGKTLSSTSVVLRSLRRYQEALAVLRRALAIEEKALGKDNVHTAQVHGNLGNVLGDLGKLEEAMEELQRALALLEKLEGPEHPDVAQAHAGLGMLWLKKREGAKARAELQQALTINKKVFGPRHPLVTELQAKIDQIKGR